MNPITNIPDECVVLDTETTGFEPEEGHRLVEIGAIKMRDGLPTREQFHVLINPERIVPQAAVDVHGLDNEALKDAPLFKAVAGDLLDFVGDLQIVAHNANFDRKFVNYELEQLGLDIIEPKRWIDSVAIARRLFPGSPANLDALCRRFNISLTGRSKHGALIDTELLADVLVEMGGGRQQNLFGLMPEKESQALNTQQETVAVQRTTIITSTLDDETVAAHKAFVAEKLGPDSLWAKFYEGENA